MGLLREHRFDALEDGLCLARGAGRLADQALIDAESNDVGLVPVLLGDEFDAAFADGAEAEVLVGLGVLRSDDVLGSVDLKDFERTLLGVQLQFLAGRGRKARQFLGGEACTDTEANGAGNQRELLPCPAAFAALVRLRDVGSAAGFALSALGSVEPR